MHKLTPDWYQPRPDLKKIDNVTKIIGTGIENIKIIENWLSEEDCDFALSIMHKYPVDSSAYHSYVINEEKFAYFYKSSEQLAFETRISDAMISKATELYGLPLLKDKAFLSIVHPTGTYIDPHTDILDIHMEKDNYESDTYESQIQRFPYLWSGHLSILAYLNDDYGGGELYFPEHNFAIKPKRRMLIMFPGNLHYVHGVAKITSGTRYTLSQWSKFKDFIPTVSDNNENTN